MNPVDRFQALIRHPEYRRDARRYIPTLKIGLLNFVSEIALGHVSKERWREVVNGYTVLRTWGLDHAVDPDDQEQIAAVLAALRAGDFSIFTADLRIYDADSHEDKIDPGHGCRISLYVDLERSLPELKQLFAKKISEKRQERGVKPKQIKPLSADPWKVWDKKIPGTSLWKVTRTIFQVRGKPEDSEKAKQAYEKVQRAHRRAVAMIREVGASRNQAITKEAVAASLTQGIRTLLHQVSKGRKA